MYLLKRIVNYSDLCLSIVRFKISQSETNKLNNRRMVHSIQSKIGKKLIDELTGEELRYSSVSHCGEVVTTVVSKFPVGIDIEKVKHEISRSKLLTSSEKRLLTKYSFTELWTIKESSAKLFRVGLASIDAVSIQTINNHKAKVEIKLSQDKCIKRDVYFYLLDMVRDYKLCITFCSEREEL